MSRQYRTGRCEATRSTRVGASTVTSPARRRGAALGKSDPSSTRALAPRPAEANDRPRGLHCFDGIFFDFDAPRPGRRRALGAADFVLRAGGRLSKFRGPSSAASARTASSGRGGQVTHDLGDLHNVAIALLVREAARPVGGFLNVRGAQDEARTSSRPSSSTMSRTPTMSTFSAGT